MRFVCEWCYQRVSVIDRTRSYGEILAHLTVCPRRSALTTEEQVAGLAAHISSIIADREEERIRQAG